MIHIPEKDAREILSILKDKKRQNPSYRYPKLDRLIATLQEHIVLYSLDNLQEEWGKHEE